MATGINIDEFKTFTEFLAKKSGKGDYATPNQFNQLVNRALIEYCTKENSNKNQYQAGRPISNVSFEKTSDVMDNLRYIKETREFVVDQNSEFGIPDGSTVTDINGAVCPEYIHWKSLRHYYFVKESDGSYTKKEYDVDVVRESELGRRLVSAVNPPSKRYAIAQELSGKFKVYPKLQYVVMDYTRYPVTAVWAYTLTNNRPVYDATNSVNIELPKECMNGLTMIYLSYLGINMRDGELIQYAEMKNVQ
jgi:hypothetical protein